MNWWSLRPHSRSSIRKNYSPNESFSLYILFLLKPVQALDWTFLRGFCVRKMITFLKLPSSSAIPLLLFILCTLFLEFAVLLASRAALTASGLVLLPALPMVSGAQITLLENAVVLREEGARGAPFVRIECAYVDTDEQTFQNPLNSALPDHILTNFRFDD